MEENRLKTKEKLKKDHESGYTGGSGMMGSEEMYMSNWQYYYLANQHYNYYKNIMQDPQLTQYQSAQLSQSQKNNPYFQVLKPFLMIELFE